MSKPWSNIKHRPAVQVEVDFKGLFITPSIFARMKRWGWCDYAGRPMRWFDHQKPDHNNQFEEPRERKTKRKFVKRSRT